MGLGVSGRCGEAHGEWQMTGGRWQRSWVAGDRWRHRWVGKMGLG